MNLGDVEYFFEYILNTKSVVKMIVLLNLFFLNRLFWIAMNGEVITKSQSTAACVIAVFIVLCLVYRYMILED